MTDTTSVIPTELRALKQWVNWRRELRDEKPTKVPYQPAHPRRRANVSDPQTWGTYEQAAQVSDVDGIGFVFTADDPFTGIDLDGCIDENGEMHPAAARIVENLTGYTEISPSGTGVHIVIAAKLRGDRCRTPSTAWGGVFEVYDRGRFFTMTGRGSGQPDDRQEPLDRLGAEMFPPPTPLAQATTNCYVAFDDAELLRRAFAARNGAKVERLYRGDSSGHGDDHSAADLALCCGLAFWTGPNPDRLDALFRGSGLMRDKWDEQRGETTYGRRTIDAALRSCSNFYSPRPASEPSFKASGDTVPGDDQGTDEPIARTDLGNARLFARQHADRLRHVRERRVWLAWDGALWRRDATGHADRAAKDTVRRLFASAGSIDDPEDRKEAVRWALSSQSESRIRATLALAATEPELALAADQLDREAYLYACANVTINLRTLEPRPHDPADLITLGTRVSYDPDARCPRWERFLEEIFAGDQDLIEFWQRFVGNCLTGDTREHVLTVLHGGGCNGKSTCINVLKALLGDLAVTASFDTFARSRGDRGPRNDLARLHRARLVTASESGEGRRLDEATVKETTGGDTIAARFLYGEHFEFRPQFKLMLVTNHRPRVDGDDDAIWRRLRLVPFEQSFEGREDRQLGPALEAELPGILNWALTGCMAWQRDGLGNAAAVTRATAEYRQDEDVLGAFLEERCAMAGEVTTEHFRAAYDDYCRELGESPLKANVLGKRLGKRGIHRARQTDGDRQRIYRGVTLK